MFEIYIDTNICLIYTLDSKRRVFMIEMLHSKILVGFVVFVLGFTYLTTFTTDTSQVVLEDDLEMQSELVLR